MEKCKICLRLEKTQPCSTCSRFFRWLYPDVDPEDILVKYDQLTVLHKFLRQNKNPGRRKK